MTKKILVTGGAGYIGSHTIIDLIENGYDVHSLDNLSNADEYAFEAIEKITGQRIPNAKVDLRDKAALKDFFLQHHDFAGVIHFAALKSVEESVEKPLLYYENNVSGMINLLEMVKEYCIRHFIFSSSCTVYGNAEKLPVTEDTPIQEAESPYGLTKQVCELILQDFSKHHPDHQVISLRYFNPAGAHHSGIIGEKPLQLARYLVPIIMEVATNKREKLKVYGSDYNTRDGSCVRDFIHIEDLSQAHIDCLKYLMEHPDVRYETFNVGIGEGVSVLEAIKAFEKVTEQQLNYTLDDRRPGDVEAIYSNYSKARNLLQWQPRYNIEDIMSTAWDWELYRDKISSK